jgi:CRISPR system Cascade subunit CasE
MYPSIGVIEVSPPGPFLFTWDQRRSKKVYLSRIEIPWSTMRNPYRIHKEIWQLFPNMNKEPRKSLEDERQGFLFKMEDSQPGRPARLLVQSRQTPVPFGKMNVIGIRELNPRPTEGQLLSFLLTANPVKTISDGDGRKNNKGEPKKCRVPLIKEDQQIEWLRGKLKGAAVIESLRVLHLAPVFFLKKGESGKFAPIEFEGILRVINPESFVTALQNGIGPAKGFGCGLMLVRRV